jgi:hypothetical protein
MDPMLGPRRLCGECCQEFFSLEESQFCPECTVQLRQAECDHDWQEQPGEPACDTCPRCGAVRY